MFFRNKLPNEFDSLIMDIKDGCIENVCQTITDGFNINAEDHSKCTPLIYACHYQQFEIIKYLVENGANITHKEKNGYNAIVVTYWHGEYRMGAYTETCKKIAKYLKNNK